MEAIDNKATFKMGLLCFVTVNYVFVQKTIGKRSLPFGQRSFQRAT